MSGNLQVLVDSFDEGVLIIGTDGVVRLANQAATRFFPIVLGKRLEVEEVQVQISAAARGYLRLPLEFELDILSTVNTTDRLHLKLLESPIGGGYLLLLRNITETARHDAIISNFANIVDADIGGAVAAFSQRLAGLLVDLVPDVGRREMLSEQMRTVLRQGEMLAGRMVELATFAQLFSKSPVLASERIPVMELVSALLARVRPLLEERDISLHIAGVAQDLPVIYGSRDWLVEALNGYIDHMLQNCRVRSDLELQIRPYGNFLSLQIRNHGRAQPKQASARKVLPTGAAAKGNTPGKADLPRLELGMALCKHVVELHRGSMKLKDEDGDITAFVLELPAGAPSESINPNLNAEQAKRYAEDLTRLMQRQRKASSNS